MNRFGLLEEDGRGALRRIPTAKLAGKTILITGASGLLGTHFLYGLAHCQQQLRLPLKVIAVVRRGVPDHLEWLEQRGYAQFLKGDMADPGFLKGLPRPHLIVHAATYGQPGMFMADAVTTLRLNTVALFALLERLLPEGQFLFVSSSEIYSGLVHPPFAEDQVGTTNTVHPRSCYIEAKRCGEAICNAYRNQGVDAKSVRLCLAYGPGTRPGDKRVINSFIERALREKAIRLLDQGRARRAYCYVADAIHMMWRILLEGKEPIYNVGGPSTTTITDLAHLIGRILQVPVHLPETTSAGVVGAPEDVRLDLTKFSEEFGPVDFCSMCEGVARTIEWQKTLYTEARSAAHTERLPTSA